jgi:hypothetical protein
MNSCIIIWGILALILQLLHYWKYYKNESPSYVKPFEMICGLVSPKSIGLINIEDVIHLLNKSKLMFEISTKIIIGMSFVDLCLSLM